MIDTSKVTRLELIDHFTDSERKVLWWPKDVNPSEYEITLSLQDDGKTLKIFLTKRSK